MSKEILMNRIKDILIAFMMHLKIKKNEKNVTCFALGPHQTTNDLIRD